MSESNKSNSSRGSKKSTSSSNSKSSRESKKSAGINVEISKNILTNDIKQPKKKTVALKLSHITKMQKYTDDDPHTYIDTFIKNIPYTEFPTSICSMPDDVKDLDGYDVVGHIHINKSLNHSDNMYVVTKKGGHIYIGFDDMPKKFWYIPTTTKQFNDLMNVFNSDKYKERNNFQKHVRVYIGNKDILNIEFWGFHRYLMLSNYCEKILWNSDDNYPYRKNLHKMSTLDIVSTLTNVIDDTMSEINVYSKYSKSLIKIESHGGHYIADISYDPINGQINDIPSDVGGLFVNFPFMTIDNILSMQQITPVQVDICVLLLDDIDSINILSEKLNDVSKNSKDEQLVKYINTVLKRLDIDRQFNQLDKDGVFKAFENSLDILIKTVYEHCFNTDASDDTRFYIDELLRHKFRDMINNRLMMP